MSRRRTELVESDEDFDDDLPPLDDYIITRLDYHIKTCKFIRFGKRERMPNFPEVISEYIVSRIIQLKLGGLVYKKSVGIGRGDLRWNEKIIEVKCFSSNGPISFGPTEVWDELYILDATKFLEDIFVCYRLTQDNIIFGHVKISKTETYNVQIHQNRRPRITFHALKPQVPLTILFQGPLCVGFGPSHISQ